MSATVKIAPKIAPPTVARTGKRSCRTYLIEPESVWVKCASADPGVLQNLESGAHAREQQIPILTASEAMHLAQADRDVVVALRLGGAIGPAQHLKGLAIDRPNAHVRHVVDIHVFVVWSKGD